MIYLVVQNIFRTFAAWFRSYPPPRFVFTWKSAPKRTRNEQRHLPQRQYEIARNLHSLAI